MEGEPGPHIVTKVEASPYGGFGVRIFLWISWSKGVLVQKCERTSVAVYGDMNHDKDIPDDKGELLPAISDGYAETAAG